MFGRKKNLPLIGNHFSSADQSNTFRSAIHAIEAEHQLLRGPSLKLNGFNASAIKRLLDLDNKIMCQAMAACAYDVRHTVKDIIQLARLDSRKEARDEIMSLASRVNYGWECYAYRGWIYSISFQEACNRLNIGLDHNLTKWLFSIFNTGDIESIELVNGIKNLADDWLISYGPMLDKFSDYGFARVKL